MEDRQYLIGMTTEIVAAYVGSNDIEAVDVPRLIRDVYSALDGAAHGVGAADAGPPKPAISVKKSINPDYIICLEDGLKFKSLKRHLSTKYEMSPEEYRQKWGLPPIIQWWRRTTQRRVLHWPRRWAWGEDAIVRRKQAFLRQTNSGQDLSIDLNWHVLINGVS